MVRPPYVAGSSDYTEPIVSGDNPKGWSSNLGIGYRDTVKTSMLQAAA
jgi:hypothetical protein